MLENNNHKLKLSMELEPQNLEPDPPNQEPEDSVDEAVNNITEEEKAELEGLGWDEKSMFSHPELQELYGQMDRPEPENAEPED